MSVPLPLDKLRSELERRAAMVYLLTVGEAGRPHCVAVRCAWLDGEIDVRTGSTSARNAGDRPTVTLLAPPVPSLGPDDAGTVPAAGPGGTGSGPSPATGPDTSSHSLIVDGDVVESSTPPEGGGLVRIRPVHAVFHRPAAGADGAPAHDCVPVLSRSRPAGRP